MTALEARALADLWAAGLAAAGPGLVDPELTALVTWARLELDGVDPSARAAALEQALGLGGAVVESLLLAVSVPERVTFAAHTIVVVRGGLVDSKLSSGKTWHHAGCDWRGVDVGDDAAGGRVWRIQRFERLWN